TSCAIMTCASGVKTWLTNCSATAPLTNSGSSATISNSAAGYTGSATYPCTNGAWGAASGTSCTSTSCALNKSGGGTQSYATGTTLTAYQKTGTDAYGNPVCTTQSRTCTNGTWS